MNPFVSRITGNSWVLPVSVLSLVLGVMLNQAWITDQNRAERVKTLAPDQQNRIRSGSIDLQDEYTKLLNEVSKMRDDKTKLENAVASQTNQGKVLNDSLQEAKLLAGLTEVEGSGAVVTLSDSRRPTAAGTSVEDQTIHDIDVLKVVNELWASGAEAIAVNGHRVVGSTSFRCVGPTILVDGIAIASPVKIRAIGDPDTLEGGLMLPLGVIAEIRSTDSTMASIEKIKNMTLPAYAGSTTRRYLSVPKEKH